MNDKASITALLSLFGRAFYAENEEHPVFCDNLAKELMTEEEYAAVKSYILSGAQFFEPEIDTAAFEAKELFSRFVNIHIAPSPLFARIKRKYITDGTVNRYRTVPFYHAFFASRS